MSIGPRIIQIRNRLNMSQRELSQRSGIASSYLSRIENRRLEPQPRTLRRIAQALGVPVSELFEERPQPADGQQCAVSVSGQCIMDLIHSGHQKPSAGVESYSPRQLQMLGMFAYLLQTGNTRLLDALEVVIGGLLTSTGQDAASHRVTASPPASPHRARPHGPARP